MHDPYGLSLFIGQTFLPTTFNSAILQTFPLYSILLVDIYGTALRQRRTRR